MAIVAQLRVWSSAFKRQRVYKRRDLKILMQPDNAHALPPEGGTPYPDATGPVNIECRAAACGTKFRLPTFFGLLAAGFFLAFDVRGAGLESRLSELNCTACHAAPPAQSAWLSPKAGPSLAELGGRTSPDWVSHFLTAPNEVFPGTTMPDLLGGRNPAERAEAADLLTHYLYSVTAGSFKRVMPDRAAVPLGEDLFKKVGCVACHGAPNSPAASSNPLPPNLHDKWSYDGLRRFLQDPLAARSSGRMPGMKLNEREAAEIAHFLLRETQAPAPLELIKFRGSLHSFDEFDTAAFGRTGPASNFTLDETNRDRGSSRRFTGWLQIDQPGDYTFFLTATGASRFAIDDEWLTGQESWDTGKVDEKRTLRLDAGPHLIKVDYVERDTKPLALKMEWQGPGFGREEIPSGRLSSERVPVPAPKVFQFDPAKAERGRALYAELNCAACHETNSHASGPPPALAALHSDQGCLAEHPGGRAPDYHLDAKQRDGLRAELAALNRPTLPSPTPRQQLALGFSAFNCTACHSRDGSGGPGPGLDTFFTSNAEDLGDEGRLPPRLDGVGDKLSAEWLAKVLGGAAGVRPYLNTRMPVFGAANVGRLAELFITLDRQPRRLKPVSDSADARREAGRQLVGTDGLSCIVCHRFNRQPAQTIQVIDLTTTAERLNEDWFREFLVDPNRFHPGTRMPSFWPNGISLLPAVLGGDSARQHAALWTYLADGSLAKTPVGLSRQSLEIIVGGEPVVYRGKLWEAGFRAIAAGYPGGINAAFDAGEMRLALLWRGQFLNAGPHWTVQGMGQIHPLGTNVVILPHGSPLAFLATADDPWPTEPSKSPGMRFKGYQLDALKRPTWLYAFGNVEIKDLLVPIDREKVHGLRRTVTFADPPPANLYFRLATGKLAAAGKNAWRVDGAITVAVKPPALPLVRGKGDHQELLLPVQLTEKNQSVEVGYAW